jgi:PAS domain S-box-containing protein
MQLFKTMTLKSHLTVGFSLMVAIIALVVFINIVQVRHALELSHRITDIRTPTAKNSMIMLNGVNHALAALRGWMLLGQDKYKKERAQVWSQELHAPLLELKKQALNWTQPENVTRLHQVEGMLFKFEQFQQNIEDIAQTPDNTPALKMFFEQAVPLETQMSDNLIQMIEWEASTGASDERKALLGIMAKVHGTLVLSFANIQRFLLSGDKQIQTQFEEIWRKNEHDFYELKNNLALFSPEQLKAFKGFSRARENFSPLCSQIFQMRRQPDWNLGNYWLATQASPLADQLITILEQMTNSQQQLLQDDGRAIENTAHNLIHIEWILLGLGALLAGFFGWSITRDILKQVGGEPAEIAQITKCVAAGNLEVPFGFHGKKATGIYASLQDMVKAHKDIFNQANRLAQGDYSVHIVPRSEKDILGKALFEMTKRLGEITTISEAIAAGDYSRQIDSKGKSDLLGQALNQMTQKLQQVTDESQKLDWLKTGQTELNEKMRGEQELSALTQNILSYIADYLNAQVGVFFLAEGEGFKLVSSYAYKQRNNNYNEFKWGEGLIGQAALEKKSILFTQVPKEHINLSINSGMGESPACEIFVLPLIYEEQVLGVLELATSRHFTAAEIELLDRVADNIAITLSSAQSRLRMQALLDEYQKLTHTLQTQQEEVLESEERIRAIVDTVIDAIITIDEKGIIESFNPAAEQLFGYTWSEVIGQNLKMLMPEPYHSEHDQYLRNYLNTGHAKIIGNPREVAGRRKDGSTFPIDLAVSEMIVGDKRLFTGIIRDITERKKADEALREQQEELQSTNEELRSQQEALQEANEELQTQQEELAANNEELQEQQEILRVANTKLEERTKALEESRHAIEEKAQALEISTRYKSEFLANMSHELRTPLNSMLILAQLLAENKTSNLTDKQVEYAQTIHSAGSDLLTLINDILDLSKVEAGKMEVHAEDVSLAELLEMTEHKFGPVAEKKGLAFHITVAEDVPPVLYTDIQRLKQIINNLLSNAFKFTGEGEVKLTVQRSSKSPQLTSSQSLSGETISPLSQPAETVGEDLIDPTKTIAFSVADTGIGIPKEKQDIIFDAFKQVDGTTSRRYGGTGLGLSISRQLAQRLGGELQLSSEEGKGSTFTLYLPEILGKRSSEPLGNRSSEVQVFRSSVSYDSEVSVPSTDKTLTAALTSAETVTPTAPSEEATPTEEIKDDRNDLAPFDQFILIIEDDNKFSRTLMELAREKCFKCILAADGKTGLQLAEQYQPNAIILDVGLPQMDGWTVMDRLKDNPETRHIPVHFISASDEEMDAKKMGAIGYLLKPVSLAELGKAFKKIEQFIAKTPKNLLVVAANKTHQPKILDLVGGSDAQTTLAETLAEALQQLHTAQFDCIILDLDIEPGAGIQLLEPLHNEDNLSQIPVIIYADRELTPSEEATLQRCANNLTVKAVRSPERLVDEATLFLHQIEANLSLEKRNMIRMVHDKEAILKNQKVLVVDDDMRNVFALVTVLEDKDMEAVIAQNGYEALALLEKHPDIALVLMDIMMPEMDGYEAMQKIRKQPRYRQLPIIALTAKAMKGDKTKCIEAGANDYISKPVDTEKLISLLRVWLYQ